MTGADLLALAGIMFGLAAMVAAFLAASRNRVDDLTDEHTEWLGADSFFHGGVE